MALLTRFFDYVELRVKRLRPLIAETIIGGLTDAEEQYRERVEADERRLTLETTAERTDTRGAIATSEPNGRHKPRRRTAAR